MGIRYSKNTDKKECLKLINHINSFLFEQEFGELEYAPPIVIKRLKLAAKELADIVKK